MLVTLFGILIDSRDLQSLESQCSVEKPRLVYHIIQTIEFPDLIHRDHNNELYCRYDK